MVNMSPMKNPKIIFVPYPAQGHVTPMLNLASAFLSRGFHPVIVTPEFIHRRIASSHPSREISHVGLSDGQELDAHRDFFAIEKAMENVMPFQLERLLLRDGGDKKNGGAVVCVVVDLLASWAIPVARRCGTPVAGFWPAMLATYRLIETIPELIRIGIISRTGCPRRPEEPLFLQNQPTLLSAEDLPWLIGTPSARKGRFKFWKRTLERSKSLPWLLVNSFPDEYQIHQKIPDKYFNDSRNNNNIPKIFTVGPFSNHASTVTKSPSLWEEDTTCMDWLKKQNRGSVVYVSFGSWVAPIGESKVRSLALALESSNRPFLWVLDPTWLEGLPRGFSQRVKSRARIVSWAPQMDILRNDAVGCYLTHCGWNSTMEAVRFSRRLLCYPVAGDQFINCAYIVNVWRIGVKIDGFGEREIEEGLKRVMEDDREEMDERLRRLVERVMGEEASLNVINNLNCFADNLIKKHEIESCLMEGLQDFGS